MAPRRFQESPKGTAEDLVDGKLSWLAAKIPKASRTGDLDADNDAELNRTAYVRVVDILWKNPHLCMPVQQFAEQRLAKSNSPNSGPDGSFEKLTTIRALDETWCAGWAVKAGGLSQANIERWKEYDCDAVRHLMVFALGCNASLRLPEACRDKAVTTRLFSIRYQALGHRLRVLPDATSWDPQTFAIKWQAVGIYALQFEGNYAKHVTHRPTNTTVDLPAHVHISQAYDMVENHSEWTARCELKPNKYFLHDFFVKGQGPHSLTSWRGDAKDFKEAVNEASASVETERRRRQEGEVKASENFMGEQLQKKKEAAAEKARAALKARMENNQKRRRISWISHGPTPLPVTAPTSAEE